MRRVPLPLLDVILTLLSTVTFSFVSPLIPDSMMVSSVPVSPSKLDKPLAIKVVSEPVSIKAVVFLEPLGPLTVTFTRGGL